MAGTVYLILSVVEGRTARDHDPTWPRGSRRCLGSGVGFGLFPSREALRKMSPPPTARHISAKPVARQEDHDVGSEYDDSVHAASTGTKREPDARFGIPLLARFSLGPAC
jgi:hypothetical protein